MSALRSNVWGGVAVVVLFVATLPACRSEVCARMLVCCRKIEDEPGVGKACGAKAAQVEDRETCRSILDTIGYMYEDRDEEPPKACQFPESGGS